MLKIHSDFKNNLVAGFTLVELLVVIAVIGVLATAVILTINPQTKINQAKDAQAQGDISQIVNGLQAYYAIQTPSAWPSTLDDLTVTGELKTLPTAPDGSQYSYSSYTAGFPRSAIVYTKVYNITDPNHTYWCWDSNILKIVQSTSSGISSLPAHCTP